MNGTRSVAFAVESRMSVVPSAYFSVILRHGRTASLSCGSVSGMTSTGLSLSLPRMYWTGSR